MKQSLKILVSNRALPTNGIGSWTTRLTKLNLDNTFFDFVLSPSSFDENYLYCKKRRFITWRKEVRNLNLKYWVAIDYIRKIKILSKKANKIVAVIMDDVHLLEAIILVKNNFSCSIEIIFSFHGFKLDLKEGVLSSIDKIFFLSQKGYEISKQKHPDNFPKSIVVGNGIDSSIFFPLADESFLKQRKAFGFSAKDEILIWVANDRPKKGIHLFYEILNVLLLEAPNLKVIIIGSKNEYEHLNVSNIGPISNDRVAEYLKISNYYMFTTFYEEGFGLSMVEALKCGNSVIATNKGAIPEVLHELDNVYLINYTNDVKKWIEAFYLARKDTNFGKSRPSKVETDKIWNYNNWEKRFIKAINED